jgi:hypothetical protein
MTKCKFFSDFRTKWISYSIERLFATIPDTVKPPEDRKIEINRVFLGFLE